MKLFERHETEETLDRLPDLPPGVEVPDDISALPGPTTVKSTAGGFRWVRWLAAIVVGFLLGAVTVMLLDSNDTAEAPAIDYMAKYGTDNPVILEQDAVPGTVEIVGTVNLMDLYGTDNPVFVGEPSFMDLYGTDNPVFVGEPSFMDLYGTDNPVFVGEPSFMDLYGSDNPVFVPEAEVAQTVDTGEYFRLYGTDNPVFEGQ